MNFIPDSVLQEVPQQELHKLVRGSDKLSDGLSKACMPYCVAVAKEWLTGREADLLALGRFIDTYGAHTLESGQSSEYYESGRGWNSAALARDLRAEGHEVVLQNFLYDLNQADIEEMVARRRLSSIGEVRRYLDMAAYGGQERALWLEAVDKTIKDEGAVLVTISIPKRDGSGYGGHGVLVHSVSEGMVQYFDSDRDAIQRYVDLGIPVPDIEHEVGRSTRYYRQPTDRFTERMTGEAMHIY